MLDSITGTMLKKTAKTVVTGVLSGVSNLLDKGAEFADEAVEYIETLDKKDTSGRDSRKEKRNTND